MSDTIAVHYAPEAPINCGFFLVVTTRRGTEAMTLPENYKGLPWLARQWPFREPVVEAVVDLGGKGAVIVVAISSGASNVEVLLIGQVGERLAHLDVGSPPRDLSLYGSSGVGVTDVACARGGPMRVLSVWPTTETGKRWGFSTLRYERRVGRFVLERTRTSYGTETKVDSLAARAGFGGRQFAGCAISRTGRF